MRASYRLMLGAGLVGVLGASRPAGQESSVREDLEGQLTRQGAVRWVPSRRLEWRDFVAHAPATAAHAAHLTSGLLYATQCRGGTFEFGVLAAFVPLLSWVRDSVPAGPPGERVLAHEQTHFDISELGARLARRALMAVERPCDDLRTGVAELMRRLSADERELQVRYDRETSHGALRDRQRDWELEVRARLDSLAGYATPVLRAPGGPAPAIHEIRLAAGRFQPALVTARAGDTLRFVNVAGGPHNIMFFADSLADAARVLLEEAMRGDKIGPLSSPLLLDRNEVYAFAVPLLPPGRYPFACLPHVAGGMSGALIVPP